MHKPIARLWITNLFVLLSLTGCGAASQVRPQSVIEVPVPAYRPLPAQLTTPLAEPAPPPARCTANGKPAVCVLDGLTWIEDWRGVLQHANQDRATAARISKGTSDATE